MALYSTNIFRHKAWMSTAAYWLGTIMFFVAFIHQKLLEWLPHIILMYIMASITISVGYHRLFCHNSFKTSKFWHVYFAIAGILYMYTSPIQWAATHYTHHKHSDTNLDPHPQGWQALLFKGYRSVPVNFYVIRKLFRRNNLHRLLDKYYLLIYFTLTAIITVVFGTDFLFYAYLPTLGLAHFIGALHNFFSHRTLEPRNLWFLEYLIPISGEWLHKNHHDKPGRYTFKNKPYEFDMGSLVVNLIKTRN